MRNKKTKQRVTTVSSGQLKVYRGITFKRELDLFRETDGYVMSQAALDGYGKNVFNGMNFRRAWKKSLNDSQLAYNNAVTEWGGVHWYCLAHAQLGTELTQQFGPRAMISQTTDLAVARKFAGAHGYVLVAKIPLTSILNKGLYKEKSAESEVLVANGVWAMRYNSRPRDK